jgi:sterol 14-demethylase
VLERVIKEVLRLHPPLIILMRGVLQDFQVAGHTVPVGKLVAISPAVSHHIPELFAEPERFDPGRYAPGREEDANTFGWIPFGGGHHRCSGSAFALMQLKAITVSLLRNWEFELVDPPQSYAHDYTKMVVQPKQPCRVRYRRRHAQRSVAAAGAGNGAGAPVTGPRPLRVTVDLALCQGHGVCMSEAPEVFTVGERAKAVTLLQERPPAALRHKIEMAVKYCPTRALAIKEE